ncbi:MAG: VOC family protein [bacterium]|nr:VOC family protein [bacterium]
MAPKLKQLQHIAIIARDIDVSLRFYRDVLGFRMIERHGPGEAEGYNNYLNFMTITDEHHVINVVELAPENRPKEDRSPSGYGLHHFAFSVEDKAEFDAWYDHLKANGVKFVKEPVVHSPTHPEGDGSWGENRAMYFPDPDGNLIEIFCDMGILNKNNEFNREWHAGRLKRDGHDPAKTEPPVTGKYKERP